MATELALIETVDTAKELAADRVDLTDIVGKIEALEQVRINVRLNENSRMNFTKRNIIIPYLYIKTVNYLIEGRSR